MDTPAQAPTEAAALDIGYVENRHGEQWIFTCNRATRAARLRGGHVSWASAHPVRDARVDGLILAPVDGLILAPEGAAWLQACWNVPLRRHGHEEPSRPPRADRPEEPRQVEGRPGHASWMTVSMSVPWRADARWCRRGR